jgi:hypothetical protein
VQFALDPATVGIAGQDESFSGRAQRRDFGAYPLERLLQRFLRSLQRGALPVRN